MKECPICGSELRRGINGDWLMCTKCEFLQNLSTLGYKISGNEWKNGYYGCVWIDPEDEREI
jgi:hypothetical protein